MKNGKLLKLIMAGLSAVCVSLCALSVPAYAENFTRNGNILMLPGGKMYYLNVIGGTKAYIPIDLSRYSGDAEKVKKAFTTEIGISSSEGSMADSAAFRYMGFGSAYANLFKYAAVNGLKPGNEWLRPTLDIGSTVNLSPRYAGIGITGKWREGSIDYVSGQAISNPDFVADSVQKSGAEAQKNEAVVYKRAGSTGELSATTETVYGYGSTVLDFADLYTNGADGTDVHLGSGVVLSNKATNFNNDETTAQKAFERWLNSGSEYAKQYMDKAIAAIGFEGSNLAWWQYLNRYFQINGDPMDETQSVYFYVVGGKASGKIFYRTYSIPAPVGRNVTPTDFAVRSESGQVLGESYRSVSSMNEYEGCGSGTECGTITLKTGQLYSVDAVLTYLCKEESSTRNGHASINFYATDASNKNVTPIELVNLLPQGYTGLGLTRAEGAKAVTGSISTDRSAGEYRYGSAGFGTSAFTVTEKMPSSGYLCVSVPTGYSENCDNDVTTDDVLRIRYTLEAQESERLTAEAYGDMNLGQLELRQYNYFLKKQVDDKEKPELDAQGKPTGKYAQPAVYLGLSEVI